MKLSVILFIAFFCLTSCQIFSSEDEDIDPDLLGEWIRMEKRELENPSPVMVYRGWSITSDGAMNSLGVDGRIGDVSLLEAIYPTRIDFARDGKMLVVQNSPFGILKDTINYNVNADILSLDGSSINGTFERTKIGHVIASPAHADFIIKIDTTKSENALVSFRVPTAYISKISKSEITLNSFFGSSRRGSINSHYITVNIDNFEGSGTYVIDKNQGYYFLSSGNVVSDYITKSDSSGTVSITCVTGKSRCSGKIEFFAYLRGAGENPDQKIEFSDGTFDLPVFE